MSNNDLRCMECGAQHHPAVQCRVTQQYITKDSGKRQEFDSGMCRDSEDKPLYTEVYYPLLKRYGELMQRGAKKYGRSNWQKACTEEELQRFKDSLLRHTIQYLSGEKDEDHQAAILFNVFGCAMVEDKINKIILDEYSLKGFQGKKELDGAYMLFDRLDDLMCLEDETNWSK